MRAEELSLSPSEYGDVLSSYLNTRGEEHLYKAGFLSQACIEAGMGPEDIIALHFESLDSILAAFSYREQSRAISDAHQFLLEIMISYGVKFREYLELKLKETVRDAESRAQRDQERILEAERVQREKTEILAVIAHEMRTPITVARGNLDMAARSLSQGKVDPVSTLLGTARAAMDRLSRLSADLVEASRGEAPAIQMSLLNLATVINQACSWAKPSAEAKGITLFCDCRHEGCEVMGNQDALLSTMGNLLSNAVRYTPPGGRVEVSLEVDEAIATVTVRDTGIGMPPEVQARIFDKFYRGPEARTLEAKGLGLGLSLVRQMMEAHGGHVEVSSTPGQGSSFRVTFLRATGEQAQQQSPAASDLPNMATPVEWQE